MEERRGKISQTFSYISQKSRSSKLILRKNLRKHPTAITITAILLIIIAIALFIRIQPASQPFAELQAENAIFIQIQQDIINDISTQYPDLPQQSAQQTIVTTFLNSTAQDSYTFKTGALAGRQINISQEINSLADNIKVLYQDDNNSAYLPDIDTYYWLAYAENVIERGSVGYEDRNGSAWDSRQLAPNGREIAESEKFHPFFLAYSWKALNVVSNLSLREVSAFYPLFVVALTLFITFLIGRRLGSNTGGLIAAAFLAINPYYVGRTLFGRIDTDAWVIFFTALTIYLILEAFMQKKLRNKILAAIGAGFSVALYSITWNAWQYIFIIVVFSIIAYIVYSIAIRYKEWKKALLEQKTKTSASSILGVFLLSSTVFTILLNRGTVAITNLFQFLARATELKSPVLDTLWPNVLTTVAELGTVSISNFVQQVNLFLLFFALVGLLLLSSQIKNKNPSQKITRKEHNYWFWGIILWWIVVFLFFIPPKAINIGFLIFSSNQVFLLFLFAPVTAYLLRKVYAKENLSFVVILLLSWLSITLYFSLTANRFLLLFSLPLSISAGMFIGLFAEKIARWVRRELHLGSRVTMVGTLLIIILLLGIPFNSYVNTAWNTAQQERPTVDDAWWDALKSIEANSSDDAIITSWWDFGHQFKQIAGRSVTFDGATQATPQAYWVGRFFLEQNETKAHGILRMLNCGGNTAFEKLNTEVQNTVTAADTLDAILGENRQIAKNILLEANISENTISQVLEKTHCTPPDSFVITSEDMIGKSGVWAHFGSWNLTRAAAFNSVRTKLHEEEDIVASLQQFGINEEEATKLVAEINALSPAQEEQWLAPWPSYRSHAVPCTANQVISCQNGFIATLDGTVISSGTFEQIGLLVHYNPDTNTQVYTTQNETGTTAVTVVRTPQGRYFAVHSDIQLANSMFTRMFFEEGTSLKHFDLLTKEENILGTTVYVWKAKW